MRLGYFRRKKKKGQNLLFRILQILCQTFHLPLYELRTKQKYIHKNIQFSYVVLRHIRRNCSHHLDFKTKVNQ